MTKKQNNKTQKTDYVLTKEDCKRLLREYPDLKAAYELYVKMDFTKDHEQEGDNEESKSVDIVEDNAHKKRPGNTRHGASGH